nr:ThuA domain-containing protein [Sandaracinobacteroides sayramensis]
MRRDAVLVASGRYHDIDYARAELLMHLGERMEIRTRVREDYADIGLLAASSMMISYTCDVVATPEQVAGIRDWLSDGGRWFALHGTNSILRFTDDGRVDTPDEAPEFMQLLGSRFAAHPPIERYRVDVADPAHPLVRGIEPFEVTDEQYLAHLTAPVHVLLDTWFEGETPRFVDSQWPGRRHPIFYLRRVGRGGILYLTLGHCRGHHDMQPLTDWWPDVDRGSWEEPAFRELVRRGIGWAAGDGSI